MFFIWYNIAVMSIRIRKTGDMLCAAKCDEMKGDTYINDSLHYQLAIIQKVLVPDKNEEKNGRWYWLHGECNHSEHPEDCQQSVIISTRY